MESELEAAHLESGPAGAGSFTYLVSPVLDLAALAERFGVGKVLNIDNSGRRLEVQALLPDPVPDYDVEQLIVQHGAANVATLVVENAAGDPAAVKPYLQRQAEALHPSVNLQVAGLKPLTIDSYVMTLAPVGDLAVVADQVRFGSVTATDAAKREIRVAASLPKPLPTPPTAVASSGSASNKEPAPGESRIDWALRLVKQGSFAAEPGLLELTAAQPTDADRQRVSQTLVAVLAGTSHWPEKLLAAMVRWKTPEAAKAIADKLAADPGGSNADAYINALAKMEMPEANAAAVTALSEQIANDRSSWKLKDYVAALEKLGGEDAAVAALKNRLAAANPTFGDGDALAALGRIKTRESADAIAAQLTHPRMAKDAAGLLRRFGATAEPTVILLLNHPVPDVRGEAARILYEIGSQDSIIALEKAAKSDSLPALRTHFRLARKSLNDKLAASGSPFQSKDADNPFQEKDAENPFQEK